MNWSSGDDERIPILPVLLHYDWYSPHRDIDGWQTVHCPVHEERKPSARLSIGYGYIVCMACGWKGDAIDLIKHKEGVSFVEAVRIAEAITGESSGRLRGDRGRGRGVPGVAGSHTGGSKYVPPRLRGKPTAG